MNAIPSLLELAEAGAHYGHHRSLTYPKARPFVWTVKNNVSLINLEKTQAAIKEAQKIISEALKDNKTILFVGTKRNVREITQKAAESIGCFYITERWFGGFLTNFSIFAQNLKKMTELKEYLVSDKAAKLEKKERLKLEGKLARYERFLKGIVGLNKEPDLLVIASGSEDKTAVDEANRLGIPIIAITDTDINPDKIFCPIPANDDAPKAVSLILQAITAPLATSAKTVKNSKPTKSEVKAKLATKKTVAKKKINSKKSKSKTEE